MIPIKDNDDPASVLKMRHTKNSIILKYKRIIWSRPDDQTL